MRVPVGPISLWLVLVTSAGAAERDIVRTFAVQPGATLSIDTYRGGITVNESDRPEIRVAVHLEIGVDQEPRAERVLRGLRLDFTAEGNTVKVLARHPVEERALFLWQDDEQIAPTYRVTVPRHCNLELRTLAGAIVVGNVSGRLAARSETGDVFFRDTAGSVDAGTNHGTIVISRCVGRIRARALRGVIRVGVVTAACDLENSSGDVEVLSAKSDVKVYAVAGSATIGLPRDFRGRAQVTTDGGIITLKIDPAAKCEVRTTTSLFSRIESHLPLAIESGAVGSRKLIGRLNGGGSLVVLHASGGNVRLLPGDTVLDQ